MKAGFDFFLIAFPKALAKGAEPRWWGAFTFPCPFPMLLVATNRKFRLGRIFTCRLVLLLLLSLLCNALLLGALLLDASRIADDDARGDDDGVAWEAAAPARPESDGGLAPALAALLSLRALRRLAR